MNKEQFYDAYHDWQLDNFNNYINLKDEKGRIIISIELRDLVNTWVESQDDDMSTVDFLDYEKEIKKGKK